VEFERHINRITVDVRLSSLIPPLPPSPSPPQFAHNEMQSPRHEPLPYSKGCGFNQHHLSSLRSEDVVAAPLPFSKGCGWLVVTQWKNRGRRHARGNPRSQRPHRYVMTVNHDPRCSSFSSFLCSSGYFYTQRQYYSPMTKSITDPTMKNKPSDDPTTRPTNQTHTT